MAHAHDDGDICWECAHAKPGESQDERRRRYVEESKRKIKEHGWLIQAVMSSETSPGWAYTIGLRELDHPELVIANLPPKVAHGVLNELADRVKNGEKLTVNTFYDHVISNYAVTLSPVEDTNFGNWFNVLEWVYGDRDWPVLQVWWPDFEGHFPWQEGYDVRYEQPTVGVDES